MSKFFLVAALSLFAASSVWAQSLLHTTCDLKDGNTLVIHGADSSVKRRPQADASFTYKGKTYDAQDVSGGKTADPSVAPVSYTMSARTHQTAPGEKGQVYVTAIQFRGSGTRSFFGGNVDSYFVDSASCTEVYGPYAPRATMRPNQGQ